MTVITLNLVLRFDTHFPNIFEQFFLFLIFFQGNHFLTLSSFFSNTQKSFYFFNSFYFATLSHALKNRYMKIIKSSCSNSSQKVSKIVCFKIFLFLLLFCTNLHWASISHWLVKTWKYVSKMIWFVTVQQLLMLYF